VLTWRECSRGRTSTVTMVAARCRGGSTRWVCNLDGLASPAASAPGCVERRCPRPPPVKGREACAGRPMLGSRAHLWPAKLRKAHEVQSYSCCFWWWWWPLINNQWRGCNKLVLLHETQPWSYNCTTEIINTHDQKVVNRVSYFLPLNRLFPTASCFKLPRNNDNAR
jgi:hypothetical protein